MIYTIVIEKIEVVASRCSLKGTAGVVTDLRIVPFLNTTKSSDKTIEEKVINKSSLPFVTTEAYCDCFCQNIEKKCGCETVAHDPAVV